VAAVAAVALLLAVPMPSARLATEAPDTTGATVSLSITGNGERAALERDNHTLALTDRAATTDHGADTRWTATAVMGDLPTTIDLQDLLDVNGGRIPSGLSVAAAKGPFTAAWTDETELTVLTRDGGLVDAALGGTLLLTYSGGGLTTPRVLTVDGWQLSDAYVDAVRSTLASVDSSAHSRALWKHWVPVALLLLAVGLLVQAARHRSASPTRPPTSAADLLEGTHHRS
ncbi:MAG: ferrous iron transporter, partial [Nocardioides sp.]